MMDFHQNGLKIFLSDNIRFLRKQKELSQEELAAQIGMNRGNIASYEKGSAEPKLCNLLKLADFFKVSLLDFTQRNLQNRGTDATNPTENGFSKEEMPMVEEFFHRAEELKGVLNGLHCYHCYKKKELEEMPHDMQIMVLNFEKLFEVTQVLMDSHQEFLAVVKSKCMEHIKTGDTPES